jgi:hypothetical protein
MTTIVQEGIEPLLIGEKLLQKIQYKPGMTTVFPAIEPLRADEAGDGMDLPQYNINVGGAQSFGVSVKRYGLRLKIAKRFVDESSISVSGAGRDWPATDWRGGKRGLLFDFITRSLRPAGHNNRARTRERRRTERFSAINQLWREGVFQPVGLFAGRRGRLHITSLRASALMGQDGCRNAVFSPGIV